MKWYKHDTDANMDAKIQEVLLDYGLEGYGLYFYCLELIAGKTSNSNLTFELEHDARIIARNTGSTSQKVEEMIRSFIRLRLFECSDGRITCLKMAQRLDKSMTSNQDMRKAIEKMRENPPESHDFDAHSHDSVMISHDPVSNSHARLEEIRIEEIREGTKTRPRTKKFIKPTREEVQEYMMEKGLNGTAPVESESFIDHYTSNGWLVSGKTPMKNWKASVRQWLKRPQFNQPKPTSTNDGFNGFS